nr:GGDEF domain-containing protein [Halochromatium salexigens]
MCRWRQRASLTRRQASIRRRARQTRALRLIRHKHTLVRITHCFGHHIGDVTRAEDVVGRWGGDEFVVLIGQDRTAALGLAERLLEEIRAAEILNDQGEPLSLNASIGLTCLRANQPVDLDALLHQADLAMLDVKRTGRGRIGVAPKASHP